MTSRWRLLVCLSAIIAAGLMWRLAPLGLPPPVKKYGGSLLWGAMWMVIVLLAASHRTRLQACVVAFAICVGIEAFKLVHAPWLDAFRLTWAGQFTLGRIFDAWSFPAYFAGIVLVGWLSRGAGATRQFADHKEINKH